MAVVMLNGFYYFVTADGYRRATRADYERSMRDVEVLPFGEVPQDWAGWVDDEGAGNG